MQKAPKEETLSEIEPVISSIAQGPAKNTRLYALLTDDSDNRGNCIIDNLDYA